MHRVTIKFIYKIYGPNGLVAETAHLPRQFMLDILEGSNIAGSQRIAIEEFQKTLKPGEWELIAKYDARCEIVGGTSPEVDALFRGRRI